MHPCHGRADWQAAGRRRDKGPRWARTHTHSLAASAFLDWQIQQQQDVPDLNQENSGGRWLRSAVIASANGNQPLILVLSSNGFRILHSPVIL